MRRPILDDRTQALIGVGAGVLVAVILLTIAAYFIDGGGGTEPAGNTVVEWSTVVGP